MKLTAIVIAGVQFKLRKYLAGISQSEENVWRSSLLSHDSCHSKPRKIHFEANILCLKGFAIFVGGLSYFRACERTLECLSRHSGNCSIPSPPIATDEDEEFRRSLQESQTTAQVFHATEFVSNLLNELVLFDPVLGKKVVSELSVSSAFQRYLAASHDQISLVSSTKFRVIWDSQVAKGGYIIKEIRKSTKCDVCLQFQANMKKVL